MRSAAAALLLLALVARAAPASQAALAPGSALAPYRELAGSPQGRELLAMARQAMRGYFDGAVQPDSAAGGLEWPGPPAGVYVSLVAESGVRACVGSPSPLGGLAETVRTLAVRALSADSRRAAVRREELPDLRLVISFAGPPAPVADPHQIDPAREALLVTGAGGSVAFLPGEARTVAWALREARRIGVVRGRADAGYQRFPVVVLSEPARPRAAAPENGEADDASE